MEEDSCKNVWRKFEAGHKKSSVGFILFIIIVLKTTNMYGDLIYYYYFTKLTFFSDCAHEKAEIIDLKKLAIFVWHVDWTVYLELQSNISHFDSAFDSPLQELSSVITKSRSPS